ncbi:hypothetical protein KPL47_09930 [Clostridium estertheticum]|uniref:hypothetical protein n=1 Tax=Clostridium estertheticum TaxID=238834 RepID=UPI001C0C1CA1|nr:hypothetical protein [Clostridium estertheticum]MBU3176691.1 hypothetical protein [Clostridium estertheticum]
MGNYNTQYQSYYNNLARRQRGTNKFHSENYKHSSVSDLYIKRLTRELIGVLTLFIIVLLLKVVITPKTQFAYNYSKEAINKQYNYSILFGKVKDIRFNDVKTITIKFLDKVKSTIPKENGINNNIDF